VQEFLDGVPNSPIRAASSGGAIRRSIVPRPPPDLRWGAVHGSVLGSAPQRLELAAQPMRRAATPGILTAECSASRETRRVPALWLPGHRYGARQIVTSCATHEGTGLVRLTACDVGKAILCTQNV
jgi:hypothetical protein